MPEPPSGLRGLPLEKRILQLGEKSLEMLLPPYEEATLQAIVARHGVNELHWPYYLENWPATLALAGHLDAAQTWSENLDVLDLGCGGGVMACFLKRRFGILAWCLDRNPEACALTALNLAAHGLPRHRVVCADFTRPTLNRRFDRILGGEMLYAQELIQPVLRFLRKHLKPGGEAWFGDNGRYSAENFLHLAQTQGFTVKREEIVQAQRRNAHVYLLTSGEAHGNKPYFRAGKLN